SERSPVVDRGRRGTGCRGGHHFWGLSGQPGVTVGSDRGVEAGMKGGWAVRRLGGWSIAFDQLAAVGEFAWSSRPLAPELKQLTAEPSNRLTALLSPGR